MAERGPGADGAGAAGALPAGRLAMWVLGGLLGRVAGKHVIDEVKQAVEALWC